MALVLEDGSGVSGANSYESVENLKAYAKSRGISLDAYPGNSAKEIALVKASSDWVDGEHSLKGSSLSDTQGLHFPISGDDEYAGIKQATIIAALMDLQGLLFPDLTAQDVKGIIESEDKGLGPLSKSVTYQKGTSQKYGRVIPKNLQNLIKPYLAQGGGLGSAVRV